ncbi:MAG: LysR family transcriptional regulator [Kangiellaceae bacterium]|nr:LysR family transcriptional regulator [Kangiellaceae bacterium]MCW8998214.1 LysR family transcriptional regulator [Kangiellaceae bacterium]MCW9017358.1 LysR family transcriptional regulator [Kangiellaceae bacterium]
MNLNDIKVFINVVEAGSFAGAGKALDMPSTTVSRKVLALEACLGVKLLHRSTRKLSLTEEGSHYFQLCQQHLVALEEANALITQAQSKPKGKIRITSPLDFAIRYVQPWITEFLREYPEISIELDTSDDYVNMVEDRIDVAFRSGTLQDSSLIARRIGPKQNICCASPEFLKRVGGIKRLEDLEKVNCIVLGKSLTNNHWHFIKNKKAFHATVSSKYATNSMHLVIESALNGLGVAYIPIALSKPYLDSGQLIQVLKNYDTPQSNMFVIYQSHRYMAKPIRLFIDHVMEKVTPTAPWML